MSDRERILADLSAYLDGELSPAQAQRVEQALAKDAEAAREMSALRRTRELVRGLPRVSPSGEFVAGVLAKAERLRLVGVDAEPAGGTFPYFRWAAAAAVLLVAVGVGVAVGLMLYNAPTGDRQTVGPIASNHAHRDKGIASAPGRGGEGYRGAPRGKDGSLAGATGRDSTTGLTGDERLCDEKLYTSPDNFDLVRKDVDRVLRSNDLTPAETKNLEANGEKQLTLLIRPKNEEQARQVRAGLEEVRNRYPANQDQPVLADRTPKLAEQPRGEGAGQKSLPVEEDHRFMAKGRGAGPAPEPARPREIASDVQAPRTAPNIPGAAPATAAPAPLIAQAPSPAVPGPATGARADGVLAAASVPASGATSASAPTSAPLLRGATAVKEENPIAADTAGPTSQTMRGLSGNGQLARTRSATDSNVDFNFNNAIQISNAYAGASGVQGKASTEGVAPAAPAGRPSHEGASAARHSISQAAPATQPAVFGQGERVEQQAAQVAGWQSQRKDGGAQAFLITLQSQPPQANVDARVAAKPADAVQSGGSTHGGAGGGASPAMARTAAGALPAPAAPKTATSPASAPASSPTSAPASRDANAR